MADFNNDISILIDKDIKQQNFASNIKYPQINYEPSVISHIGSDISRQQINFLSALLRKRKVIRDETVGKLQNLLLYCSNRILDIGENIKGDPEKIKLASIWQKEKVAIYRDIASQESELFKDCLFLNNEIIKAILLYTEEKKIDELIESIENQNKVEVRK